MGKHDLRWYACVYEGEKRIVYGRAPLGEPDNILDEIKRGLRFHKLIGLQSRIFLRESRFNPGAVHDYCERHADKNPGDYRDFSAVKLDLRWE